jgi:D-glycerate 3-kinase
LDDFYLTLAERKRLASEVSPLFKTRGPAGTHDLGLLNSKIDALLIADDSSKTPLPVFDKKIDDRAPEADFHVFSGRPKAVVIEGWMIGALPLAGSDILSPINRVEEQDSDGKWRAFQEEQLANGYKDLWDRATAFFHIEAPSFEVVRDWRIQQEETTLGLPPGTLPEDRIKWVENFILHYESHTNRLLAGKRRPGAALCVDRNRQPVSFTEDC